MKFSKVTRYNISIQKSAAFLYVSYESLNYTFKIDTIYVATKYLGIYLIKGEHDLYGENYKALKHYRKT